MAWRVLALALALFLVDIRAARSQEPSVELVVETGRPLRVALADSISIRRVDQSVSATVVDPVYAYDRVVVPAGARVTGRVAALENPSRFSRLRSMLSGDFSPHRIIQLQFDALDHDGAAMPMRTVAKNPTVNVTRQVAKGDETESTGVAAQAKEAVASRAREAVASAKQRAADALSAVKQPGRLERVKEWAIERLPYHPQTLRKGTTYDAELKAPLSFGRVAPHAPAPQGTMPAPASVLTARLTTTLDSSTSVRGTPLEAVVAQPVFADDGRLIYPEGTKLTGEVTFAQPARRLHRNGQLRFLFERVQPPQEEDAPLLASLHAIDVSHDDRLVLDDEGGAAVENSKARFVTPALALLAMRASLRQGEGGGLENGAANVEARTTSASLRSRGLIGGGVGGFIGFGLLGAALGPVSRPIGFGFAVYGFARSMYTNVLGRGRDVVFQADTPIQVQLAPGRDPRP